MSKPRPLLPPQANTRRALKAALARANAEAALARRQAEVARQAHRALIRQAQTVQVDYSLACEMELMSLNTPDLKATHQQQAAQKLGLYLLQHGFIKITKRPTQGASVYELRCFPLLPALMERP